jgi:fluoride exporter
MAFPWGTLAVNIAGSFLIGALATLADERRLLSPEARLLLLGGVLGGFTTFSAFSLETWRLAEGGSPPRALIYVALSLAGAFLAVAVGVWAVRLLIR